MSLLMPELELRVSGSPLNNLITILTEPSICSLFSSLEGTPWFSNLTLILRRSRTGTVWFYTSTSNKRAARPKLYT